MAQAPCFGVCRNQDVPRVARNRTWSWLQPAQMFVQRRSLLAIGHLGQLGELFGRFGSEKQKFLRGRRHRPLGPLRATAQRSVDATSPKNNSFYAPGLPKSSPSCPSCQGRQRTRNEFPAIRRAASARSVRRVDFGGDRRAKLQHDLVYVNGGQRGLQVRLQALDLVSALNAIVAPIVA